MQTVIVQSHTFLTLLGGGSAQPDALETALRFAPILVAVDGGAATALAQGHLPEAIIGDFDSLDAQMRQSLPRDRLHCVTEQDSTDFEKALLRVSAPLILGVGFTGLRRDHELAAYHALMRFASQPCILMTESDVICLCPPQIGLDLPVGTRVSLFPMAAAQGQSTGLRWPIDGLKFAPGQRIGTSNAAALSTVSITMDRPAMLLILPVTALTQLIDAIARSGPGWGPQPGDKP